MDQWPNWISSTIAIVGALGAVVTAVATFFLWRVTKVLAVETKRMAEAADNPHVVVTLEVSPWSLRHLDIHIENTGNSTAYDIEVLFDPPLENGEARKEDAYIPFQSVSVLKPGQALKSYISDFNGLEGKAFNVQVSWIGGAMSKIRKYNNYELRMRDQEGVSFLGDGDPLIQISKSIKSIDRQIKSYTDNAQRARH